MKLLPLRRAKAAPCRFDVLLRPHLDRLYRLAFHFTGSREDAEDLVQTLLVKLLPKESQLAEVELLSPWLARALYRLYVDHTRKLGRQVRVVRTDASGRDVIDQIMDERSETPELAAERLLSQRRLSVALMNLSADHRAVLGWHDIEGYTLEELAESLGLPIGTLKSRLHRARAHLRELLMEPSAASERVGGLTSTRSGS